jgi:hypothetical protein
MPHYRLSGSFYVMPTPAGAYFACASPESEPARALLFRFMGEDETPLCTLTLLRNALGPPDDQSALETLFRMQSVGWVQGMTEAHRAPVGALEDVLPELLGRLSSVGKALLADDAGFYVATHGFPHETAEELSALSADLASLYERHKRLLHNNLGIPSAAWGIVDAAGNSQVGFWPLYIGAERFVLAVAGLPRLNQPALIDLVWALAKRYADSAGQPCSGLGAAESR